MKKSDLKTGMRVLMRNGEFYLVLKDVETENYGHQDVMFVTGGGFMGGSNYDEDLIRTKKFRTSSEYDILEVFTIHDDVAFNGDVLNLEKRHLIWKRQEYTDKQKEIFKALKILGFSWIARDDNGNCLMAYEEKPLKRGGYWIADVDSQVCDIAYDFDFIKWEDNEPFEIPTL